MTAVNTRDLERLYGLPRFDIEASAKCNVKCLMCPRDKMTRPRNLMPPALMDTLVNWLPETACEIFFCGLGEPLLNPAVAACITTLHNKNRIIGLTSNGVLLTPATVKRLIEAKIDFIHVSVPSLDKKNYERMMKGSTLETVLGHLQYLAKVKPNRLAVELAFTEQATNVFEVETVNAFARKLGFGFQRNLLHSRGGHLAHRSNRHNRGTPANCAIFSGNHFITCEGDILACCHDLEGKTVLGNIKDISFAGLLKIKESRIKEKQWFDLCATCDDTKRFRYPERT